MKRTVEFTFTVQVEGDVPKRFSSKGLCQRVANAVESFFLYGHDVKVKCTDVESVNL